MCELVTASVVTKGDQAQIAAQRTSRRRRRRTSTRVSETSRLTTAPPTCIGQYCADVGTAARTVANHPWATGG